MTRTLLGLLLNVVIVLGLAATAQAGSITFKAPDLRVVKLSGVPPSATPGSFLQLKAVVKNRGSVDAKASKLAFVLSPDPKRSASDIVLGPQRSVKKLARGKSANVGGRTMIPTSIAARSYFVLACADVRRKLRERNEKNNCAAKRLEIGPVGAPPPPPDPDPDPGPQPPIDVQPALDEASAASSRMGRGGGMLMTSGADGTSYRLVIPEGALLEEEDITMTPIASLEGLPFAAGLTAGVDLGPDGLQLLKPAILTIDPPGELGPSQTPFGYHGNGQGLYLQPPTKGTGEWSSGTMDLALTHFSGAGTASATSAEKAAQRARVPSSPRDRAHQRLGDLTASQRGCALGGSCGSSDAERAELLDIFHDWHTDLSTEIDSALGDPARLEEALSAALDFSRAVQLYGLDDEFAAETAGLASRVHDLVAAIFDREFKRCADGDFSAVESMTGTARAAELVGMDGDPRVQLGSAIEKCLTFEVDLDINLTRSFRQSSTAAELTNTRVAARGTKLKVHWSSVPSAPLPLVYSLDSHCSESQSGSACWEEFGGGAGAAVRLQLDFSQALRPDRLQVRLDQGSATVCRDEGAPKLHCLHVNDLADAWFRRDTNSHCRTLFSGPIPSSNFDPNVYMQLDPDGSAQPLSVSGSEIPCGFTQAFDGTDTRTGRLEASIKHAPER